MSVSKGGLPSSDLEGKVSSCPRNFRSRVWSLVCWWILEWDFGGEGSRGSADPRAQSRNCWKGCSPQLKPFWPVSPVDGDDFSNSRGLYWWGLRRVAWRLPRAANESRFSAWPTSFPRAGTLPALCTVIGWSLISLHDHNDLWRTRDSPSLTVLPRITQTLASWPQLPDFRTCVCNRFAGQPSPFLRCLWSSSQMVAPLVPISLSGRHSGFCTGLIPHTGPAWDSAWLAGLLPFFIQNSDAFKLGLFGFPHQWKRWERVSGVVWIKREFPVFHKHLQ